MIFILMLPFRVHNVAHAFRTIVTESGVRGLWRGWVPNVQRAALVNMGGNSWSLQYTSIWFEINVHFSNSFNSLLHTMECKLICIRCFSMAKWPIAMANTILLHGFKPSQRHAVVSLNKKHYTYCSVLVSSRMNSRVFL